MSQIYSSSPPEEIEETQIKIGEKIYDLVEVSGREYLDPEQITFLKKPIPLEVQKNITKRLNEFKYETSGNIKEKFIKVVEAYVDLHKKDGRWAKEGNRRLSKTGEYDSFEAEGLGVPNTSNKFLKVGEDAKLYDKKTEKTIKPPSQPKTIRAKVVEEDLKKFQLNDLVKKWQDSESFADQGHANARKLWQALIVLDLSPAELLEAGGNTSAEAKLNWIKDRMKQETFTDVSGKKWKFGEITRDKKTGRLIKSGWVFETGAEFGSQTKYGKGAGTALIQKGKGYKSKFHDPRAKEFKKGNDGVRKVMSKMIRHFLVANDVAVADQPPNQMLSQKVQEAHHGTIHMSAEEILAMIDILRDPKGYTYEIFDERTNSTYKVTEEHWEDAYMYFIIGLSIGWRREEALTAVCKRLPVSDDMETMKKTLNESGLIINPKTNTLMVWLYTRKTERVGQAYWGGYVLDRDVGVYAKEAIMKKLERIERKDPKLKLYTEVWDNPQTDTRESYDLHPLIGRDDQYIGLGTMTLPKNAKLSSTEKEAYQENNYSKYSIYPQVREKKGEINKLMAIFRYCYKKVGLTEDYWYTDSLHAVRHTFAQMWIKKSKRDLAWVMKWGHWGGVDVLEKHYGQQTGTEFIEAGNDYAEISLESIAVKEKEQRETAQAKAEAEKKRMEVEMAFGASSKATKSEKGTE